MVIEDAVFFVVIEPGCKNQLHIGDIAMDRRIVTISGVIAILSWGLASNTYAAGPTQDDLDNSTACQLALNGKAVEVRGRILQVRR